MNTQLLVERDNSLPRTVLADFLPLGASMVLLSALIVTEGRLGQ
jgi:hypothetical protein